MNITLWNQINTAIGFEANVTNWQFLQQAFNTNTTFAIASLQNQTDELAAVLKSVVQLQSVTSTVIQSMNGNFTDQINLDRQIINATRDAINAARAIDNANFQNAVNNVTTLLLGVIGNLNNRQQSDAKDIYTRIAQVEQTVQNLDTTLWSEIHLDTERSVLWPDVWQQLEATPSGYVPFVGTNRYTPLSDQSFPLLKRLTFNTMYLNYVALRSDQLGPYAEIHANAINIYFDRDAAISNSRRQYQMQQWILQASSDNCSRSVITSISGAIVPEDPHYAAATPCLIWVEVTSYVGRATSNGFSWQKVDLSLGEKAAQPQASYFAGGLPVPTVSVFRNFLDFYQWYQTNACVDTLVGGTSFQFGTVVATPLIYSIASQTAVCNDQLSAFFQSQRSDVFAFLLQSIQNLQLAFNSAVDDARLKKWGRLPDGIKFEQIYFKYVATNPNASTADGGADIYRCMRASWIIVSQETVPIYTYDPFAGSAALTKNVVINSYAPVPGSGFVPAYNVQPSSSNVLFVPQQNFPTNFDFVGDLQSDFIYDVPPGLILTSADIAAQPGKLTYLMFNPALTTTPSFDSWVAANGRDVFDPFAASVSVQRYKYPKGTDSDGFPYCDTTSTLPSGQSSGSQTAKRLMVQPEGILCRMLRDNQIREVFHATTVEMQILPREWAYEPQFQVPSGAISQDFGSSNCSLVSVQSLGLSGLRLSLQNVIGNSLIQQVTWTDGSGVAGGCNQQLTVTVPSYATLNLNLPECANLTITVSKALGLDALGQAVFLPCATISNETIATTIASYAGIPKDIADKIALVQSSTLASIDTVSQSLLTQTLGIMQAVAASVAGGDAITKQIEAIRNATISIPFTPIIWGGPANSAFQNTVTPAIADLVAAAQNESEFAAQQFAKQAAQSSQVEAIISANSDIVTKQAAIVEAEQTLISIQKNFTVPPLPGFPQGGSLTTVATSVGSLWGVLGSALSSAGIAVGDVVEDGVALPGNIISGFSGAVGGFLSGVGSVGSSIYALIRDIVVWAMALMMCCTFAAPKILQAAQSTPTGTVAKAAVSAAAGGGRSRRGRGGYELPNPPPAGIGYDPVAQSAD